MMFRSNRLTLALGVASLLAPGIARADFTATTTLSGLNETPPNSSPAVGEATIIYDATLNQIMYDETYSGLTTNATASHIHVGGPGVAGPVVLPFTPSPTGTSGHLTGILTPANATGGFTFAQIVDAIQNGNAYVNLHTTMFGGGEIRGQLAVVPGPGALPIFAGGLTAGAAFLRRRRRK